LFDLQEIQSFGAGFPSEGSNTLPMTAFRGEDLMSGEIFDQASLRSAKAQRFADAFAGCGEWIEPEPRRRRRAAQGPFDGASVEPMPTAPRYSGTSRRDRYRPAA
jgi:hypothetical protein